MAEVRLPNKAVSAQTDISDPVEQLLRCLNLLPDKSDLDKAGGVGSVLAGPPASVALIEANATALSKWWAAGLGLSITGSWAAIAAWWNSQQQPTQRVVLWAAAIATGAAILAIGYMVGSDVRGRAAAMVATIEARSSVAVAVVQASQRLYSPDPPPPTASVVSLPAPLMVRYSKMPASDEAGWRAVAVEVSSTVTRYLVVKGSQHAWADAADVVVEP